MEKKNSEKLKEPTLHELLSSINARLGHLEDIGADNRTIIIKLVKQGNDIVQFLKEVDIEADEFTDMTSPSLPAFKSDKIETNFSSVKELIEEYMEKATDLKEFKEELEKHKGEITPGQIGES
jgi:isopropylmalate/homocitrate/citramalate synthase